MRFLLAILFLLPGAEQALRAQDLTGQWTGTAANDLSDKKEKLVLNMAAGDSSFGGVLHWYDPQARFFRYSTVNGWFHSRDSTLSLWEDSTLGRNRTHYLFRYKRTNHKEVLEGRWNTDSDKGSIGHMVIRLEKKATPFIPLPPLPPKKKDSAQQRQVGSLIARETPVTATIPIKRQDSVRIDLFDNGEIDGDSVSLYLNNDLILMHLSLRAEPRTIWLPLDKRLSVNKLVLFAENLGKLPPNTAVMEVTTKGKIYTIFLSTDYNRNASVEFVLQE